ncbi:MULTISPECIES: hypothetical protein [unclassified Corynebacterium]|uniref:hypothetical protein n=1 Tax=unclassified Corynebacterium TaxID=2624378 RepID=UPI0029CA7DFE|nr:MULTISPECIES: hypothetical protein [unclassified Corynebacterium]WPF66165.1 hypothetical protein OLX12_00030 [Corynebacterium sp. 22KM0430]WPF68657.1 hypothetical protein OLW90_00030 [Corynebacterium sp. 21KM1197]
MKALFRTVLLGAIAGEILLVTLTLTNHSPPAWTFLLVLGFILSALAFPLSWLLLTAHRERDWLVAIDATASRFGLPRKALSYWVSEILMLGGFARKRPGGATFGYSGPLRTIVWAISALVIVEIVVVHLVLPSATWRVILAVLSVYGLMVLLGFYASLRQQPHSLTEEALILRSGHRFELAIPRNLIARSGAQRPGDGANISVDEAGLCRLPILNQVNTVVELAEPARARDLFLGEVEVRRVEFSCDEREELLARLGQ